jgi:ribonuclease J
MDILKQDGLYFMPVGGADEIGLNMYVYAVDGQMIIVDTGYGFLGEDYPGMDMGIVDASFLEKYQDRIQGLFITHAHEDHFGAIAYSWPKLKCPVYASSFAAGMIKARLKEFNMEDKVPINIVKDDPIVKTKDFNVEFVSMVHTIPETAALVIRTKYGNIVHATDWRFDDDEIDLLHTDMKSLKRIADEGVLALISDSTNILVDEEHKTEKELRDYLLEFIPTFKKGLVATCFSTNIVRLETLIMAAVEAKRVPVLVGRSIIRNMEIVKELGYLGDLTNHLMPLDDVKGLPKSKILYICTGGQGEYRSALARLARQEIKDI